MEICWRIFRDLGNNRVDSFVINKAKALVKFLMISSIKECQSREGGCIISHHAMLFIPLGDFHHFADTNN